METLIRNNRRKETALYRAPLYAVAALCAVLLFVPTGFEDALQFRDAERCVSVVMETDDSRILDTGLVRSGHQTCTVEFVSGKFKGMRTEAVNLLTGSLESDKLFSPGDRVQTVVHYDETETGPVFLSVNLIDHYRLAGQAVLALLFALFLIMFSGRTGLRAVVSFAFTVLSIWKILVPFYLKGWNPVYIGIAVTLVLTLAIIALVYGFDMRWLAASSGAFAGVLVTCLLGIVCTGAFKLHGAVMPWAESLLYSGYQHLNLTGIFMASIFIGASGAMMDLSVDITSAVHEIVQKKPGIGFREICASAMNIARAAMGTMTTTLLLAYSGGSIAVLMVFMAQGTPPENLLNYRYISAEIIETVVGSFGLVTVGPFTAVTASALLTRRQSRSVES